jgi:peroxiredoxin Q/BCP
MTALLSKGAKAPSISGKDQNGNNISLKDFQGSKLVLYFYPKDNTPGCTTQSCNLRDNYKLLEEHGFKILGVSVDDEKSHQKFISKFELPFPLVADTDHKWVEAFGVWGEKSMYGRKYMGTYRVTYLIDEKGVITDVIEKVKTADHTQQILDLQNGNG